MLQTSVNNPLSAALRGESPRRAALNDVSVRGDTRAMPMGRARLAEGFAAFSAASSSGMTPYARDSGAYARDSSAYARDAGAYARDSSAYARDSSAYVRESSMNLPSNPRARTSLALSTGLAFLRNNDGTGTRRGSPTSEDYEDDEDSSLDSVDRTSDTLLNVNTVKNSSGASSSSLAESVKSVRFAARDESKDGDQRSTGVAVTQTSFRIPPAVPLSPQKSADAKGPAGVALRLSEGGSNGSSGNSNGSSSNGSSSSSKRKGCLLLNQRDGVNVITPLGIPVRDLMLEVFRIKRKRKLYEAFIYVAYAILYFVVFIFICDDTNIQAINGAIDSGLYSQEFTPTLSGSFDPSSGSVTMVGQNLHKKTFRDIASYEEFVAFIEGPFFGNLWQSDWYNGDALGPTYTSFFRYNMRVLGSVRMRQARVDTTKCETDRSFELFTRAADINRNLARSGICLPGFSSSTEMKRPFGPPSNPNKYVYVPKIDKLSLTGNRNWGGKDYGQGGYVAFLPANDSSLALSTWASLKRDRWIDSATRAIALDFALLNSDLSTISVVQLVVEFLPTGRVDPKPSTISVRVALYENLEDGGRFAGEVLLAIGLIFAIISEWKQFLGHKPRSRYFAKPSNLFDLLMIALTAYVFGRWAYQHIVIQGIERMDLNDSCQATKSPLDGAAGPPTCFFPQIRASALDFRDELIWGGAIAFSLCIKIFKYFSIFPELSALFLTLRAALKPLIAFFCSFIVLSLGFTFLGMSLFGPCIENFRSIGNTFSTLMRFPLGDFNYHQLAYCDPVSAPVFFGVYMGLVFIVCMNVAVSILTLAYNTVNRDMNLESNWKHAVKSFSSELTTEMTMLFAWFTRWAQGHKRNEDSDTWGVDGGDYLVYICMKHFSSVLCEFTEACENGKRFNLLTELEEIYHSASPGRNIYVGLPELCALVSRWSGTEDAFCQSGHTDHNASFREDSRSSHWYSCEALCSCSGQRSPKGRRDDVSSGDAGADVHFRTISDDVKQRAIDGGLLMPSQLNARYRHRCIAWQLVQAYFAYKDVALIGQSDRHAFWNDKNKSASSDITRGSWQVLKASRNGRKQERRVGLEEDENLGLVLSTRDKFMRLRRKIPLPAIVLIEASIAHPSRVILHMESGIDHEETTGSKPRDEQIGKSILADTVYDLTFKSYKEKMGFISTLIQLRKEDSAPSSPRQTRSEGGQMPRHHHNDNHENSQSELTGANKSDLLMKSHARSSKSLGSVLLQHG